MANEKRLIDANALCEAVDKSDRENFHKGFANRSIHHYEHIHFMKMVLDAPTVDAVEVVRCGECRFVDTDACPMSRTPGRVSASDFCSYGERRAVS